MTHPLTVMHGSAQRVLLALGGAWIVGLAEGYFLFKDLLLIDTLPDN